MNRKLSVLLFKIAIGLVFIFPLTKMVLMIPEITISLSEIEMSNNTLFIALATIFLLSFIILKFIINIFPRLLKILFNTIDTIYKKPTLENICKFHKIKYLKEKRCFIWV